MGRPYQLQAERIFHLVRTKRMRHYLLPIIQPLELVRIGVGFTRDAVFLPKLVGRTQEVWAQDTTAVMVCMWTKVQSLIHAARTPTAQFLSHTMTARGSAFSRVVFSFARFGQLNVVAIDMPMYEAV